MIEELSNNEYWRLDKRHNKPNEYIFHTCKNPFTDGRYRMEIKKLKRKVEGKIYKVFVYYTPYHPDTLVRKARVNTYQELMDVLKEVNTKLGWNKNTQKALTYINSINSGCTVSAKKIIKYTNIDYLEVVDLLVDLTVEKTLTEHYKPFCVVCDNHSGKFYTSPTLAKKEVLDCGHNDNVLGIFFKKV